MREATEMEGKLLDASLDEAEWTKVWAEYAGLIGRIGFLQQRVLARRIALLGD